MADAPAAGAGVTADKSASDDLTLFVGDNKLTGWEDIEVTLRAEGFPNSFSIGLSSKEPITSKAVVAKAGDPCRVMIGSDLIITGYVDRDIVEATPESHRLMLVGRGKTQDLVDCSAEWPSGQQTDVTAVEITTKIAKPYGIAVALGPNAKPGGKVPQWTLNYGETGAEIVQRVARNAGLLAYEDAKGQLILGAVGSTKAASGVVYGKNVEACSVTNSMDERYSEIVCCGISMDAWGDLPGSDFFDTEPDPNVPRHRLLYMVLEQAEKPQEFTIQKAKWEIARRAGRAATVRATVDSWRDSGGKLWTPNTLIPVDVPGLRIADKAMCLSEVTYRRSNDGTRADLVLLPPAAFTPEPINLQPINAADVAGPDAPQ